MSQLNQPWKIEFESQFLNSESVIYEWQELRKPRRNRKVLFLVAALSVGFLLLLMAFILLPENNQQVAISGSDYHTAHTARPSPGQVCDSETNAISAAHQSAEPREEVNFGGVKYQNVLLSCLGVQSKWLVEWVKTGGAWQPESASRSIFGANAR